MLRALSRDHQEGLEPHSGMASIARLNQHVASFLASTAGFAVGVAIGWSSLASVALRLAIGWEPEDGNLIVIDLILAAGIGSLLPIVLPLYVRGRPAIVAAPLLVIGWLLLCIGDYTFKLILVGRLICGAAVGMLSAMVPLYIGETSCPEYRDVMLFCYHCMISSGIFCSYAVARSAYEEDVVQMGRYSLGCAAASIPALMALAVKPSPLVRLACKKGSEDPDESEDRRMQQLAQRLIEPQIKVRFRKKLQIAFKNRRFQRNYIILLLVMACHQFCGFLLILFDIMVLFDFIGTGEMLATDLFLLCGAILVIGSLAAMILVKFLKKRILMITSSILSAICLSILGSAIYNKSDDFEEDLKNQWTAPTAAGLFFASYSLGLGPVPWALLGDSFPVEMRVIGVSSITSFNWFFCLLFSSQAPAILVLWKMSGLFWLFAGFCLLGAVFGKFIPESAGKSLANIQEEFGIS